MIRQREQDNIGAVCAIQRSLSFWTLEKILS